MSVPTDQIPSVRSKIVLFSEQTQTKLPAINRFIPSKFPPIGRFCSENRTSRSVDTFAGSHDSLRYWPERFRHSAVPKQLSPNHKDPNIKVSIQLKHSG